MYIYFRIRCDERSDRTRVIVDFKVEKGSESLLYYFDVMTADPIGTLKREADKVMSLFALFTEYVGQPAQEESKDQDQNQSQDQNKA